MNIAATAPALTSGPSHAFRLPFEEPLRENTPNVAYLPPRSIETARAHICVISDNKFFRTCLTRCLEKMATEHAISSFDNIEEWLEDADHASMKIVLLCATGQKATQAIVQQGLDNVSQVAADIRTIIVSDVENPSQMIEALDRGAKGYVPMSLDLEVAIGAIKLVEVGGCFIPASGLLSVRSTSQSNVEARGSRPGTDLFTSRQLTVLEHLRKGDPNKIIAHKLGMSEATVKIHVRNMMRKIHAKNRTELVCMTNELFGL